MEQTMVPVTPPSKNLAARAATGLFVAAALSSSACSQSEEPFINPKADLELCRADPAFQTTALEPWDKGAQKVQVRFVGRASSACPGRRFPFVDATSSPPLQWIQIVEVNVPVPPDQRDKPSWQLIPGYEPWVFVDMVERLRADGEPFLNAGKEGGFWDNPTWPIPPDGKQADGVRKWRTRSYAVSATGKVVRGVAGFSWGWTWTVGAKGPEPIAPEPLPRSAWTEDAARMTPAFPGWTFQ